MGTTLPLLQNMHSKERIRKKGQIEGEKKKLLSFKGLTFFMALLYNVYYYYIGFSLDYIRLDL